MTCDVTYDVLGNERHKAVCELRKLPDGYPSYSAFPFAKWYEDLSTALGIRKGEVSCAKVRDTLIHLLGGDQMPVTLGDLYGIWKGDGDGVDARPSDSASADSPVHGAAGCGCGGTCGCDGEELLAPITTELRDRAERYCDFKDNNIVKFGEEEFDRLCDNIDAIHAGLERENEELRKRTMYPSETERVNMLEREVKRLTSECKTQRNNFDQATSAREHWKTLYEQALEQIHDLERDYKSACYINERQDCEYVALAKRYDNTISLPFDKDGKVWRIGDELLDDGMVCEVVGIGPNRLYYYVDATDTVEWTQADSRRHYHAPTVEDVLREFAQEMNENLGMYSGEAIDANEWRDADAKTIAEYAAKLRLAGSDAE